MGVDCDVLYLENMSGFNHLEQEERRIASSVDELPPLEEGFVRLVHITVPKHANEIVQTGLDYQRHGMAMSTARAWSKPEEVKYCSDDPRFSSPEMKVVVLDVPNGEWRLNNNITKAPGIIPGKYVVGVVSPQK